MHVRLEDVEKILVEVGVGVEDKKRKYSTNDEEKQDISVDEASSNFADI